MSTRQKKGLGAVFLSVDADPGFADEDQLFLHFQELVCS